ncbi:MAG: helix-turn-helix domain-containing protein [Alphaproteobacteria bacterium]|nr:helix-turn-helix domain-containing protein [Alphaproteobacteria bacterium]
MMLYTDETLAYSIKGASKACNIGQTKIYEEIKLGRLKAVKFGRRTLVPAQALRDWLDTLSKVEAGNHD